MCRSTPTNATGVCRRDCHLPTGKHFFDAGRHKRHKDRVQHQAIWAAFSKGGGKTPPVSLPDHLEGNRELAQLVNVAGNRSMACIYRAMI